VTSTLMPIPANMRSATTAPSAAVTMSMSVSTKMKQIRFTGQPVIVARSIGVIQKQSRAGSYP
jgi:hypothetical protein